MSTRPNDSNSVVQNNTQSSGPEEPSIKEVLAYGSPALGDSLVSHMLGGFATSMLVVSLELNAAYISLIIGAKMAIDAVTDPLMGHISDNWRGRLGRRRPFILAGGLLVGIFLFFTWNLPVGWSKDHVTLYFAGGVVAYSIFHTIFMVPYTALGIELSPTYDGKTRVYLWKTLFSRTSTFINPWLYPLCLSSLFVSEYQGAKYVAAGVAVLVALGCVAAFQNCQERSHFKAAKKEPIISSIKKTFKNPHFLRIVGLYVLMMVTIQLFIQVGAIINIQYVFGGDKLAGASYTAGVETLAGVLVLLTLPVVGKLCKRLGKHNALKIAFCLMIIGDIIKWWAFTPEYKMLQWVYPFCYSLGISSIFVILESMMADAVDYDEYLTGFRREGIYGAVGGFIMKNAGAGAGALSGILLVMAGYQSDLGHEQSDSTFIWLRLFNSIIPAAMLLCGLALLYKYPLTRDVMDKVRQEVQARKTK
ncbi:MFS transporter [Pelagicoccus mobilis]|uniref:MFS transporter n=1 Tax=Pelagicoccus mobilis TaxID=415221 RepID=A0A934S251_9BACT|nr:MFS transporter [Pelagicoccus mobilis]MBK1877683.1 MFS transporter [Pelagicoccus mobilis]